MKVSYLPEDLSADKESPIQIYNYHSFGELNRGKVHLAYNTFSFLLKGKKEVFSHNASFRIGEDQFLLMKSGNCLMTEQLSERDASYKSLLLFFSDEMLMEVLEKNQIYPDTGHQDNNFYAYSYDNYIRYFVESLLQILQLNKHGQLQENMLKAKLEEILLYLIQREGRGFLKGLLQKRDEWAAQLIRVVEHNRLEKLSLQELAFLSNRSISSFKREFQKHYGVSPIRWFQQQRLEHSAYLLKTNQRRPIDLYEEAGYESLSNFVRAFRRQYGISPKQFQLQS